MRNTELRPIKLGQKERREMYNPNIHKRRSIRLKGYDYSQEGYYFITICTQGKIKVLSNIVGAGLVSAQKNKLTYTGKFIQ